MPPILIYYAAGLTIALGIGIACYLTVGHAVTPFLRTLFGEQAGQMWGRLFRISVVTVAMVGALTETFYGCGGPTDYAEIAASHHRMLAHTTGQVSGSMHDTALYLIVASALAAIAFAVLKTRGRVTP